MSWDVIMIRTKNNNEPPDSISDDMLVPFTQTEIIMKLKKISEYINAGYDFSDPSWQIMTADNWSVEFNIGDGDEAAAIMLCIRGNNEPTELLKEIAIEFGTRLLDGSNGEFIDFTHPTCFDAYKAYRDKIFGGSENTK
ncbi:MAG: hypothetical protein Q4F95_00955 [Oscillospiraceae bacterium]|nr:hypothetical protein [Oscillospiraceae bacterium]